MTEQRSFKRLVRARMQKTGESYTAARAALLAASDPRKPGERLPLATSDEEIRRRTGRGWEDWFDRLDEWGAAERSHREIAIWVAEQQGVVPLAWNAQAVAGSYERARGLRAVGEHPDGFRASVTKTVAVPVEQLYAAFVDAMSRKRWLPDAAQAYRHSAEVRPLRLGRRRNARQRHLQREGRGEEHRDDLARASRRRRRPGTHEDLLARPARSPQTDAGAMSPDSVCNATHGRMR